MNMGERLRTSGVPGWAWGIIFTIFLTLMTFGVGAVAGNQRMKSDIEINKETIATKASKESVEALDKKTDRSYETLIRIEQKLDEHIKEQTQYK